MRIRKPGKVRDRLWFLGREESGVYLLEGRNDSMIVSGGISYIVPDLLGQFKDFGLDEERVTKLVILHAHFDHVGIVPFFKRRHPGMEVYASARGWEVLRMEKAIRTINEFGRMVAKRMGRGEVYSLYDVEWRDDVAGKTVHEGDRIDLGDLGASVFEIPGHSSCSIAVYVPELKALFPTDGGGIPVADTIVPSGNSNYTKYQENLERLKSLEVEYYCSDHSGYVVGEEARGFISKTIEKAKEHRALVEEIFRRTGNIDETAKQLTSAYYEETRDDFLAPEVSFEVNRQIVKHIAGAMEGGGA